MNFHIYESLPYARIQSEFLRLLPKMSRISLLLSYGFLEGLKTKFPKKVYEINMLAKKVEVLLSSKVK